LTDHTQQLDPLMGCPEEMVPADHPARQVQKWVATLDTRELEKGYSSLGRRGFHPANLLAVWLYASLTDLHYATQVTRALQTDAAFRLLSGGHVIKETTLRTFRRNHGAFFAQALQQTVTMAQEAGLIDPDALAVDSMRLRADASMASIRTQKRSRARLKALAKVDSEALDEEGQARHAEKVAKHEAAVKQCEEAGCTSFSATTPSAALMKFPSGASLPGHRITATACCSDLRLVVSLLIDASPNDYGLLGPAVTETRTNLMKAGLPEHCPLEVAADAGYDSKTDLAFGEANRGWLRLLVALREEKDTALKEGKTFPSDAFEIHEDETATCPAGRAMAGPTRMKDGRHQWHGVGCDTCPLQASCTRAPRRTLTRDLEGVRLRQQMHARLTTPRGKARYTQRMATVEPVFSVLEDVLGFRRASSRLTDTVHAEILLKVLTYNLMRLETAAAVPVCVSFAATPRGFRLLAIWLPSGAIATPPGSRDTALLLYPC
jgi:transposase